MNSSDCFSGADANDLEAFMQGLKRRNPSEKEFHQAVREVASDVIPFIAEHSRYQNTLLLERMTEPDQVISFRVCWIDDQGCTRVNRAWRVQFNNATGPYKGGLRFSPDVTESVLKFLGFEQCFKNSLTGLPIGGAKGGSNFNPSGKSDAEVMRFCQALMTSLYPYIGEHRDVPAGDIGLGQREVGYLFGQYRRLTGEWVGALTGKGVAFGGSELRVEATGYGVLYFVRHVLDRKESDLEGKKVVISGAGNVARYAAEKAVDLGARVITLSDSGGMIHCPDGLDADLIKALHRLKEDQRGRLRDFAESHGLDFDDERRPWSVPCDIALPCAVQNELDGDDAKQLIDNGCTLIAEGANMPCTSHAVERFQQADGVTFVPGKAANAGGVAVSGLERTQNAQHLSWEAERVDRELAEIMQAIHRRCVNDGTDDKGKVNYRLGANIAGFRRLADAMLGQGVV